MRCPKCYGSVDKRRQICKHCGFKLKDMDGATHKAVKQARKDGFGMDVMYTNKLPSDIKKKKLLLLCIFLGMFGAHNFYAGHKIKAIYSLIVSIVMFTFATLIAVYQLPVVALYLISPYLVWVYSFTLLFMGINIFLFIYDLIAIITNKFKVSVYKDEFSDY